jgi:NADPH-dependent glutamate synthase beta subunit-like oxidoreductase
MTIIDDNPMPAVTGRVCYHPCEGACNRKDHDEPIGIRNVERFLEDFGLELAENPIKDKVPPVNGKRVAVVGSGPGGLACAYHARRLGYRVTVFEALSKAGGMMRGGIPHWHLPEDVLNKEVAKIEDLGDIEIKYDTRVGEDGSWDDLKDFDAAFIQRSIRYRHGLVLRGSEVAEAPKSKEALAEPVKESSWLVGRARGPRLVMVGRG